jgi:hypothetical protein
MRKRRLYRHSLNHPNVNPRRVQEQEQPQLDPHQVAFESGLRHGMMLSAAQQRQAIHAAQQHALALVSQNETRMARASQQGFDRGYAAGIAANRGAQQPAAPKNSSGTYTYEDVEAARKRGYSAGQQAVKPSSGANESSIRKKMVEEMVEQCRVIAESNPQMAPGVKAVRHMIKKLG